MARLKYPITPNTHFRYDVLARGGVIFEINYDVERKWVTQAMNIYLNQLPLDKRHDPFIIQEMAEEFHVDFISGYFEEVRNNLFLSFIRNSLGFPLNFIFKAVATLFNRFLTRVSPNTQFEVIDQINLNFNQGYKDVIILNYSMN